MLEGTIIFEGNHNGVDILIRHVRRDDVERLLHFMNTISTEQTYIMMQGEQMSLEEESRYIENFMHKVANRLAVKLLVFHGEELIGVGDIVVKEKIEKHIGVFGLIISKEWRQKGLGSFLMNKVIEEAQKNITGLQIITLGVFSNNPVARKLYEKIGFKEYGLLPKGLQYKGELVDHVYMYKSLFP
ncbi:MAG: GNAT family protein [Candidatus Roizmanbacteria bacterium]|nr:GNAT family protein [Candidatus Roizmanbacteria bacterium]